MKRHVRPLFYQDVADEVAYLAEQAGSEIALRWAGSVWATVEELEGFPFLGRARGDIPFPGVRSWRVRGFGRWIVFYGVQEGTLIFYRVRHGATDLIRLDYES